MTKNKSNVENVYQDLEIAIENKDLDYIEKEINEIKKIKFSNLKNSHLLKECEKINKFSDGVYSIGKKIFQEVEDFSFFIGAFIF